MSTVAETRTDPTAARLKETYAPGHFHSPVPSPDDVDREETRGILPSYHGFLEQTLDRESARSAIPGIDLRLDDQLELLGELCVLAADFPYRKDAGAPEGLRYEYPNRSFAAPDAIFLHTMLRRIRPQRLVEIGSGYSSCVILDAQEHFLDGAPSCTFVEPNPQRLLGLAGDDRDLRYTLRQELVQDTPMSVFEELRDGDVLFIDSSHVARVGSDVNHLFFEVLPRLQDGVYVHVHDVFWPFDYPGRYFRNGWSWNECYLLRAFLMYNTSFRLELFPALLQLVARDRLAQDMPAALEIVAGNIWLRKVAAA